MMFLFPRWGYVNFLEGIPMGTWDGWIRKDAAFNQEEFSADGEKGTANSLTSVSREIRRAGFRENWENS